VIVVLAKGTKDAVVDEVLTELKGYGVGARLLEGAEQPLLHLFDGPTRAARSVLRFDCVVGLIPTSGPRIRRQGRRFYPYHFINWSTALLLLLGILVVLAGYLPPGGEQEIDLASNLAVVETPWYLRAPDNFFTLFHGRPAWMAWLSFFGLLLVGFFVPRIDRFTRHWIRGRWPLVVVGTAFALAWCALTLKGWVL